MGEFATPPGDPFATLRMTRGVIYLSFSAVLEYKENSTGEPTNFYGSRIGVRDDTLC